MGRALPTTPSTFGASGSYQESKIRRKIHWVHFTKSGSVVASERRGSWDRPSRCSWRRILATFASVVARGWVPVWTDRKSTRLNSSHVAISYAVFCLKKKKRIKDCTKVHENKVNNETEEMTC